MTHELRIEFDVKEWLKGFGMEMYLPNFQNNGFTSYKVCSNLEEEDLRAMHIPLKGHRKEILLHSADLRESECLPRIHGFQVSNFPHREVLPQLKRGGKRQLRESYNIRCKFLNKEYASRTPRVEFLLVRHGESEANVHPELYSTVADHAVKLSSRGEEQAKEAGLQIKRYFENTYKKQSDQFRCRIWTSTYKRARQTAELIKEHAGDWITDIRESIFLVEQQFGLFEGVDWANGSVDQIFPRELAHYNKCATFGGRFWARVPMGESRFDVCRRVYNCLPPIYEDGIEHVIIVSHGVTLRAFVMCYFNRTPEWFEEEPNPTNCSIKLITADKDEKYIWPNEEERKKEMVPDSDLLLIKEDIMNLKRKLQAIIEQRSKEIEKKS
jgi:broad specificity phosphatase PhoE